MLHNIRQYQVPLQKYMAMMDLQVAIVDLIFQVLGLLNDSLLWFLDFMILNTKLWTLFNQRLFIIYASFLANTLVKLNSTSFSQHWYSDDRTKWIVSYNWLLLYPFTGEEWEVVLQAPYRSCRRIAPSCLYTNRGWSLPEVWKHLQATTGSIYQFERKVRFIATVSGFSIVMHFFLGFCVQMVDFLLQGEDPRGLAELAWEEHSSHRSYWWGENFGARGSWMPG